MIALIPARKGSKRLPGKNLRLLGGVPLIGHSIHQALASALVEKVVVSTDCPEIARFSREMGAEVPFLRPAELASDEATSVAVFCHALEYFASIGCACQELLVLQPTSPLRLPADIDDAIGLFREKSADAVVSCRAVAPQNWFCRRGESGQIFKAYPDDCVELYYLPNGSLYVLRTALLERGESYYTDATYPLLMPNTRSIDIDTLEDFEMAEALFARRTWSD